MPGSARGPCLSTCVTGPPWACAMTFMASDTVLGTKDETLQWWGQQYRASYMHPNTSYIMIVCNKPGYTWNIWFSQHEIKMYDIYLLNMHSLSYIKLFIITKTEIIWPYNVYSNCPDFSLKRLSKLSWLCYVRLHRLLDKINQHLNRNPFSSRTRSVIRIIDLLKYSPTFFFISFRKCHY